jgi:hypothetical protein
MRTPVVLALLLIAANMLLCLSLNEAVNPHLGIGTASLKSLVDSRAYADMVSDFLPAAYPPVFLLLSMPLAMVMSALSAVQLTGLSVTFVALPIALFLAFREEFNERAALISLAVYLFASQFTGAYSFYNLWSQATAMTFFCLMSVMLMRRNTMAAFALMMLSGLSQRWFMLLAPAAFFLFFLLKGKPKRTPWFSAVITLSAAVLAFLSRMLLIFPLPFFAAVIWRAREDWFFQVSIMAMLGTLLSGRALLFTLTLWCGYVGLLVDGLIRKRAAKTKAA